MIHDAKKIAIELLNFDDSRDLANSLIGMANDEKISLGCAGQYLLKEAAANIEGLYSIAMQLNRTLAYMQKRAEQADAEEKAAKGKFGLTYAAVRHLIRESSLFNEKNTLTADEVIKHIDADREFDEARLRYFIGKFFDDAGWESSFERLPPKNRAHCVYRRPAVEHDGGGV